MMQKGKKEIKVSPRYRLSISSFASIHDHLKPWKGSQGFQPMQSFFNAHFNKRKGRKSLDVQG